MAYTVLNFNSAATAAKIGENPKVRMTVKDNSLMVRFTDRSSAANLSKDQLLKDLSVKGSGRRVGVPTDFGSNLEAGTTFILEPAKYGWFKVVPAADGNPDGRISA